MNTVQRGCPRCGEKYEASVLFCPHDGATLVSDESQDLVGSVVADRYLIERPLGTGGMGVVYLARDVRVGRQCAVKTLRTELLYDPSAVARFHREATNASKIVHPNVASVYDVGEITGRGFFIAMEFVEGSPLSDLIGGTTRLTIDRAVTIGVQVAAGLSAAHRLGIVHRDLKPENILIATTPNDEIIAKVVDFGIAKALHDDAQRVTSTSQRMGTPMFMSPEQLAGQTVDERSDLFSLALVTCVMLTGRLPYRGEGAADALQRLTVRALALGDVAPDLVWPPALEKSIARALSIEPKDRQESVREFAREIVEGTLAASPSDARKRSVLSLLGMLGGETMRALSPETAARLTPTARHVAWLAPHRLRARYVAISAALLSLGAIGAWLLYARSESYRERTTLVLNKGNNLAAVSSNAAQRSIPAADGSSDTLARDTLRAANPLTPSGKATSGERLTRRVREPTDVPRVPRSSSTAPSDTATVKSSVTLPSVAADTSPPPLAPPTTATVEIGTRQSAAILYVNDSLLGSVRQLRRVQTNGGRIALSLRAEGCQSWDTVMIVRSGELHRIGFRNPICVR